MKPNPTPQQDNSATDMSARQDKIIAMFDTIAKDYDKANRILSLGIDISWRVDATKRAFKAHSDQTNQKIQRVLDVACGSGDMIIHWQKRGKKLGICIDEIIGVDPSKEMLEVAKQKLKLLDSNTDSALAESSASHQVESNTTHIKLFEGEAKDLYMIETQSIDILSIAYGLRNVLAYKEALSEFKRVLKRGGVLVVLDFFKNNNPSLLDKCISLYTKHILPILGFLISKNYQAYKYLPDSMDLFLSPGELGEILQEMGFRICEIRAYNAGISHLVLAQKL